MTVRRNPQIELGEKFIEDAVLESLLEEREDSNQTKKTAGRAFKKADGAVTSHLTAAGVEIPAGEKRRCGRFLLSRTDTEEKEIEFTRGASSRLSITVAKDGGKSA